MRRILNPNHIPDWRKELRHKPTLRDQIARTVEVVVASAIAMILGAALVICVRWLIEVML